MNWGAIFRALPSLISLVVGFISRRGQPPKRAEEILGPPEEPTDSEKAKAEAEKKADEKFSSEA